MSTIAARQAPAEKFQRTITSDAKNGRMKRISDKEIVRRFRIVQATILAPEINNKKK
jgi:hypothetical protein